MYDIDNEYYDYCISCLSTEGREIAEMHHGRDLVEIEIGEYIAEYGYIIPIREWYEEQGWYDEIEEDFDVDDGEYVAEEYPEQYIEDLVNKMNDVLLGNGLILHDQTYR